MTCRPCGALIGDEKAGTKKVPKALPAVIRSDFGYGRRQAQGCPCGAILEAENVHWWNG
jgi:hypothetical protein